MTFKISKSAGALLTSVACSMFAVSALAEPAATTTAPAAKAPVAAPAAKAAPAAAAKPATPAPAATAAAPAAAKPAAPKKVVAVSPCKGLDEKSCGGNKACGWIVPKDPNDKTGKLQEPYCRKIAGVAAKKPAVKPATAAVKPAAVAPAPQVTTTSTPPPAASAPKKPATAAAAGAKAPAPAPAQ